jgi:hypothetical protein
VHGWGGFFAFGEGQDSTSGSRNEIRKLGNEVLYMQRQPQGRQVGDVVGGRYRIVSVLGSGGMSTVYLAEDLRLTGKHWAVKETRQAAQVEYDFLAEAEMLVKLNHPNLPDIVDYFPAEGPGFSYLVMDYIEGETLQQRFERQGKRMPVSQAVDYAQQLCNVFHYLHSHKPQPIIYRDIKPANLMIDVQEQIRLIDFGIARSFKTGQAADTVRIGTIGFAAPEQFEGRQTDARTDLFGLGALLYYLLSGGHYYYAVRQPLREYGAEVSAGLSALVEKLLQAEPDARFQSAAEVRDELQRALVKPTQAGERETAGVDEIGGQGAGGGRGKNSNAGASRGKNTNAGASRGKNTNAGGGESAGLAKPPPRIVAVAGLYAGAGATFAALALARALHRLGVRHAVLEVQTREPELFALLFGEKHAPAGYRCYNEAIADLRQQSPEWEDGCTLWLPAAPHLGQAYPHEGEQEQGDQMTESGDDPRLPWPSSNPLQAGAANGRYPSQALPNSRHVGHIDNWQRLLEEIDRPIILIDVGSDWNDPAVHELITLASEFVYVIDPLLHKLDSAKTRRNLKRLGELRVSGKPIYGIANKAVASSHTGQWLSVLPEPPVTMLPAIDYAKIAEASWLGVLVQDRPGVKSQLERSMHDWLRSWLPQSRSKGLLHKLRKNG